MAIAASRHRCSPPAALTITQDVWWDDDQGVAVVRVGDLSRDRRPERLLDGAEELSGARIPTQHKVDITSQIGLRRLPDGGGSGSPDRTLSPDHVARRTDRTVLFEIEHSGDRVGAGELCVEELGPGVDGPESALD